MAFIAPDGLPALRYGGSKAPYGGEGVRTYPTLSLPFQ
jgi:hypothetical protein